MKLYGRSRKWKKVEDKDIFIQIAKINIPVAELREKLGGSADIDERVVDNEKGKKDA